MSYSCRLMKTSISPLLRLQGWREEGKGGVGRASSEQNPTEFKFPSRHKGSTGAPATQACSHPSLEHGPVAGGFGPQAAFGGSHIQVELVGGLPQPGLSRQGLAWRLKTSWLAPTDARCVLESSLWSPALSWGFLDYSLAASLLLWDGKAQ